MKKHPENANEALVDHLTRQQSSLFHYILSLVPDPVSAQDILQETNLVLWRKAAEYDSALPFMPWACRIALYQVKAHRRDQARDLHVFDDEVLDQLAAEPPEAHIGRPLEQGLRGLGGIVSVGIKTFAQCSLTSTFPHSSCPRRLSRASTTNLLTSHVDTYSGIIDQCGLGWSIG